MKKYKWVKDLTKAVKLAANPKLIAEDAKGGAGCNVSATNAAADKIVRFWQGLESLKTWQR